MTALREKLARAIRDLAQEGLGRRDRAVIVTQRLLAGAGLGGRFDLSRQHLLACTSPPRHAAVVVPARVEIRRGDLDDLDGLCGIEGTSAELVRSRLRRGAVPWIAARRGRLIAHVWFQPAEVPFEEDEPALPSWRVAPHSYWEFAAAVAPEARRGGVFGAMMRVALQSLFDGGAVSVRCRVAHRNVASMAAHRSLGFRRIGSVVVLRTPLARFVLWEQPEGAVRPLWQLGAGPFLLAVPAA